MIKQNQELTPFWAVLWRIGMGPIVGIAFGIVCKKTDWYFSAWKKLSGNDDIELAGLVGIGMSCVLAVGITVVLVCLYMQKLKGKEVER